MRSPFWLFSSCYTNNLIENQVFFKFQIYLYDFKYTFNTFYMLHLNWELSSSLFIALYSRHLKRSKSFMKRYLIIMTTYPNAIEFISIKRDTSCLSAYRRVLSGAITFTYLLSLRKIMHLIDRINMIIVKLISILSVYHERSDIKKKDIYFYLFINKRNIQWLWWHLITECMTFNKYVWHLKIMYDI